MGRTAPHRQGLVRTGGMRWNIQDAQTALGKSRFTTVTMLPCTMRRIYPEVRRIALLKDGSLGLMWDE